jgi:hypothetical protein
VYGLAAGVVGLIVRHNAASARTLCHLDEQVRTFEQSLAAQVGPLPGPAAKAVSCASLDLRYDLGLVAALLGLAITLGGFLWLTCRSRRAARVGAPWPIRRAMDAAAGWIDAHLPGGHARSQPRLRGGFLAILTAILVAIAVGGAISLWNSHQRSERIYTYETATAALAALPLPVGLQRESPAACGDTVCARSNLTPPQLDPMLRALLHGTPNPAITDLIACPASDRCPVTAFGHFDGALAVGNAFWHLLVVRDGKPPKGAIPVHPTLHLRPGRAYAYWFGSDVYIGTIDPRQSY